MAAMPAHIARGMPLSSARKSTSGTQMIWQSCHLERGGADRKQEGCLLHRAHRHCRRWLPVEYRADQKRTDSKSKQAHLIGVPAHIVTIQQQIAEHECGLIEHSRLVAAKQNEQGNRSSIDEQSADRAGQIGCMRSDGHNAEKSGEQQRGTALCECTDVRCGIRADTAARLRRQCCCPRRSPDCKVKQK